MQVTSQMFNLYVTDRSSDKTDREITADITLQLTLYRHIKTTQLQTIKQQYGN